MKAVSVLTVTYNSSLTIKKCLLAVKNQTYKDFEFLLVDNNSKDNTREVIESLRSLLTFPLRTMYLDTNLGFAGGNNLAFQHVSGKYIALLNPDAFPEPTWLENLVREMNHNASIGICASKLLVDGLDIIDSAGDGLFTFFKGFKRGEGSHAGLYNKAEFVFGACAGAALYRREMLEKIGFFDEDFFLIHEDTDLNFRANLAGWKVLYVSDAVVYHKVHASIGKRSDLQAYYNFRNTEFVRIKNVPLQSFLKHLPVLFFEVVSEFLYVCIKRRKLRLYVKAKLDVIRHLPQMYAKRKAIMSAKCVDNSYLENLLTSLFKRGFLLNKLRRVLFD